MRRRALALTLSLFVTACQATTPPAPTTPTGSPSAIASNYLNAIIGIARDNSINRLTIDWTAYRNAVFAEAGTAQTIAELTPAIRVAITLLRDGHSSYRPAVGSTIFVALRSCSAPSPQPLSLPSNIASVAVGAFAGGTEQANAYARQIQDAIAAVDRADLAGWIVDLRSNGGGNMWPMIAGLGPILGEGPLGYFIGPSGVETLWEYRGGSSTSAGFAVSTVSPPYTLRRPQPRVAVLSDNRIASSGEATLIAFRERPNTRSFGQPTCGLSTANAVYPLSDGGALTLTTAVMADRNKTRFGDSIAPDEVIPDPAHTIQRAIEWITTGR
jgi:carboxyl-terminal processing protease